MFPSLINTLAPWQWVLLALVPPAIVALYFLKLRREPIEVPSTYLWKKSIEDLHVNSLWQRLRQNVLLLLQLLVLLLIMLALLRPSWKDSALSGDRFIFLVDNSASMTAKDVAPSRLEEAKRQVRSLIDQMESGDRAMIVSFSDNAQVAQEFTDNRRQLRQRLEQIEPTHRTTSLRNALKLAAGLANPGGKAATADDAAAALPADLFIFSDGRFDAVEDFQLGNLRPLFVPIGKPEQPNIGIIAFSTRREEAQSTDVQAFALLQRFGEDTEQVQEAIVDLYVDDRYRESKRVDLPGGEQVGVSFSLSQLEAARLRLEVKSGDALPVDDVAYAAVNLPRRANVLLVTPGNEALRWGLKTQRTERLAALEVAGPDTLLTDTHQEAAAAGYYDLIIYDRCRPAVMPQANTLFVGAVPPPYAVPGAEDAEKRSYSLWVEAENAADIPRAAGPQVIDVNQAHPLMHLVELGDVFISDAIPLDPPPGGTALIDSTQGILLAIAPRDGYEDVVLGFEIISVGADGGRYFKTDWWRRPSFPTFLFNALQYLGGHRQAIAASSVRPGEVYQLRSEGGGESLRVRLPDGTERVVRRRRGNMFSFSETDQVGIYEVLDNDRPISRFAVNLFSSAESNIAPRGQEEDPIRIGYDEIEAQTAFAPKRAEVWKWLLLLALGILLLEWYIYNRRGYV